MNPASISTVNWLNQNVKTQLQNVKNRCWKLTPRKKTLWQVPVVLSKIATIAMGVFCLIENPRSRSIPFGISLITAGAQDTVASIAGKKKHMIQKIALLSLGVYTFYHERVMNEFTSGYIVAYSALKAVNFLFGA